MSSPNDPDAPLSWEDILEDPSFLYEDDDDADQAESPPELSDVERAELRDRFALADVIGRLSATMRSIFGQWTMDFEAQYQQGYQAFSDAGVHLDHEAQRVESAGEEFAPIVEELRQQVAHQRSRLVEHFEEHVERHEEYRRAMVPVRQRMAEDNRAAAAEQMRIRRDADRYVLGKFGEISDSRRRAFDDWNREWRRTHLR